MVNTGEHQNSDEFPYWRLSGYYFFFFATLGAFLPYWSLYLKANGFTAEEIGELNAFLLISKVFSPNLMGWLSDRSGQHILINRIMMGLASLIFTGYFLLPGYNGFALTSILFSFFWHAALPQFEAITFFHLTRRSEISYSSVRLWGSVGFLISVIGTGHYVDWFDLNHLPYIIQGFLIVNFLISVSTPKPVITNIAKGASQFANMLLRSEILVFFLVNFLLQVSHGPFYTFFTVFLLDHNYSASITGQLWGLGVVAEILMFLVFKKLNRWLSLRILLLLSLAMTTLRWWLMAVDGDQLMTLVIAQCLHAASFGLTHIVAMELLFRYFGVESQGRGQALYSSICYGIGGTAGSLASGYLWETIGPQLVFSIAAILSCLALLLSFLSIARKSDG